jgi:hypothetical protein
MGRFLVERGGAFADALGFAGGSFWDELLPAEVRELPEDLARLDELLRDRELLRPIERHWRREAEASGRSAAGHGRPTIAMETYVRLWWSSSARVGATRR